MAPRSPRLSRRQFARLGSLAGAAMGVSTLPAPAWALDALEVAPREQAAQPPAAAGERPAALKSQFLVDIILETGGLGSGPVGSRNIVAVTGGTFEGPKLKGKVLGPGGDWVTRVNDTLRVLDVRIILLTDDDQRIYMTYRGVLYTPQGGERYWRTTPAFETSSAKYDWLNHVVAVGVPFTVPQRTSYRVFEIL